jgi:hypothetical protein
MQGPQTRKYHTPNGKDWKLELRRAGPSIFMQRDGVPRPVALHKNRGRAPPQMTELKSDIENRSIVWWKKNKVSSPVLMYLVTIAAQLLH